jgi:SET domain-containing protein
VPNCIVKIITNRAFLIAIREIEPGDELVFDYSTTSNEEKDTFLMNCNCSQFYCRKEISGYNSLSEEQKQKYDKLGGIPKYLK